MKYADGLLGINEMATNPATADFSTSPQNELFT